MGVNISPLVTKKIITLGDLSHRTIAIDANIEALPDDINSRLRGYTKVRKIFVKPPVTDTYIIKFQEPDIEVLYSFLCDEKDSL